MGAFQYPHIEEWIAGSLKEIHSHNQDGKMIGYFDPESVPPVEDWLWKGEMGLPLNCMRFGTYSSGDLPGEIAVQKGVLSKGELPCEQQREILRKPENYEAFKQNRLDLLKKDGLVPVENAMKPRPGYFLVALAFGQVPRSGGAIENDFHFYRMTRDGTWAHKIVLKPYSKHDEDGKIIKNPQKANRGNYKDFAGFFHVPKGGLGS